MCIRDRYFMGLDKVNTEPCTAQPAICLTSIGGPRASVASAAFSHHLPLLAVISQFFNFNDINVFNSGLCGFRINFYLNSITPA